LNWFFHAFRAAKEKSEFCSRFPLGYSYSDFGPFALNYCVFEVAFDVRNRNSG
jgi:hypothetical protein